MAVTLAALLSKQASACAFDFAIWMLQPRAPGFRASFVALPRPSQVPRVWLSSRCVVRAMMFRCVVLVCAAGAATAVAPQVINAEFDAADDAHLSAAFPAWDGRARSLAQRVGAAERQLEGFLGSKDAAVSSASSFLALQPVDADRVRNGLAVTEAMPAADGLNVNIVEREA